MENKPLERTSIHDERLVNALEEHLAIIRFDINKRITYANRNFAEVLGYNEEELVGKEHRDLCFPEFYESPEYDKLWSDLLNGVSFQDKIMRRNSDSEEVWLEATYFPVFDEEKETVIGVAKVATNITERQKKIEAVTAELLQMSGKLTVSSDKGLQKGEDLLSGSKEMIDLSDASTSNLTVLQKKNRSIQDIVKTIQDIASNTRLLSLNASIEAAHAGEYGRGFSVIAQEVKKLSQKVHDSANHIKEDIQEVTSHINIVVEGNDRLQNHILQSEKEIEETMRDFKDISTESMHLQKQADKLEDII